MPARSSAAKVVPPAESPVLREDVGNVAVLVLNRPAARNSLSEAMLVTRSARRSPKSRPAAWYAP